MDFAVIETGGKQYKVALGDVVTIETLEGKKEGDAVVFDKVLLVDVAGSTTIGTPFVSAATVSGTIKKIGRAQKVTVIKYKQKSRYYKKNGHRQPFMQVEITSVK